MTTIAETITYANLSDKELVGLIFTEEDRLPMAFAREVIERGSRMIPVLSEIIHDPKNWEADGEAWWAVVHAPLLLGTIGTEEATPGLIDALKFAVHFDNDWICDELPSMFGAVGSSALEPLRKIALNPENRWYLREKAMAGLAAIALRYPGKTNEIFSFIASIAADTEEDEEARIWAGHILLDFGRKEHEALLASMVESGLAKSHFHKGSIQEALSGKTKLYWYQRNWLDFYSDEKIEERQGRWEREEPTQKDIEDRNDDEPHYWSEPPTISRKAALKALGPLASLVSEIQRAVEEGERGLCSKEHVDRHYALGMKLYRTIKQRDAERLSEGAALDLSRRSTFEIFDTAVDRSGILGWLVPLPLDLAGKGMVREGSELALAWSGFGEADNFLGDRAVLLAEAGWEPEAREQIEQNLKRFPDDAWVQIKIGDAYRALKEFPAAEVQFRKGLDMAGTDDWTRHGALERLVPLLEDMGRTNEAEDLKAEERRREEMEAEDTVQRGWKPFVRQGPKVGRNEPCPCGSGKKYKKCCLG